MGNGLPWGGPKLATRVNRPRCTRSLHKAVLLQKEGVRLALVCPESSAVELAELHRLGHRLETVLAEYSFDLPMPIRLHELEESPRNTSLMDLMMV